jgi:integrase
MRASEKDIPVTKPRRRGRKGEGTSWHEPNRGRWIAQTTIHGKRRSFYGPTEAAARDKMKAAVKAADAGTYAAPSSQTVGAFLREWLADVKGQVRQSTYEAYRYNCEQYLIDSPLGRLRLDRLHQRDVDAFVAAKMATGLAPRTVSHMRVVLGAAIEQAVKWDRVPRNVVRLARKFKVPGREVVPFTALEARDILAAAAGDRLEALYVLALATGMRQGEILALHWADVDLDRGLLKVRYSLRRLDRDDGDGSAIRVTDVKTDRSRRTVRLAPPVVAALRRRRAYQDDVERPLAGQGWHESGLAFTTRRGAPLAASNFARSGWRRMVTKAGVDYRPFHTTRHTAASLMLAAGVDMRVVMGQLGHSTMEMTSDLYTHLSAAMEEEATASVAGLLF